MQVTEKSLDAQLKKGLSPIYLISSDERLLAEQARKKILVHAKKQGFLATEIMHVDMSFQWDYFAQQTMNGSLFNEKKSIDLRNEKAKFDTKAITVLESYVKSAIDDTLLIITTQKLTAAQQKTKWFKLIENAGVYLPIWPLQTAAYPNWIQTYAKSHQADMDLAAAKLLTQVVEGNLFAATQAVEKCALLYPNESINAEKITYVITDNAQFSVFDLANALLIGKKKRALRILSSLEKTGTDAILVLWAIARETRELLDYRYQLENGKSLTQITARVWASKKPLVQAAMSRISLQTLKNALQLCAQIDATIKGATRGNPWQMLKDCCLLYC